MRFTQSWLAIGALVVMGAYAVDSTAKPSLEERMDHVEKLLENKVTIDTLNEIESLKNEVQVLHGKVDEQQHALEELSKKQEKLFLDLEQKINQSAKSSGQAAVPATGKYSSPATAYSGPTATVKTSVDKNSSGVGSGISGSSNVVNSPSPSVPPTQGALPASSAVSEQEMYNAAYKLVETKNYKDATIALQNFLWKYPDGQLAVNANYWLGEIYLSDWHKDKVNKANLDKAVGYFKTVTIKYPKHHKAADSMLKLGIIESEQGNWPAAKDYFTQLKQKYPGSSRAHMADARLKKIK